MQLAPLSPRSSYAALAIVAGLLVLVSAARFRQSRALTAANTALLHSTDVLSSLADFAALRRDRELATLQWIAQDDPDARGVAERLGPQIDSMILRLARLTADDATHQARLDTLATMMAERAALLRDGYRPGQGDATLEGAVAFGRRAEAIVGALRGEENQRLLDRRAAAAKAEERWTRWALAAAATSLLLAIAALISLRVQRRIDQTAAARVRESEARFRAAAESGFDAFLLLESVAGTIPPSLRVVDANNRAAEMLGTTTSALLGQPWEAIHAMGCGLPTDLPAQVAEVLRSTTSVEGVQRTTRDGEIRSFRYQLVPADSTVALTCRDITAEVQLAEQLQQAQKLDALGRMATGVAHDFNNLLTVIRAEADLVLDDARLDQALRPELQDMVRVVDRAAGLTQRLLAFSRKQVTAPRPMALDRAIEDLRTFLVRMLPSSIAVQTEHAPDLPPIMLDPVQLDQVILNLAANARDAMPKGGVLRLVTDFVALAEDESTGRVRVPKGQWVRLTVSDTGHGMPAEVIERIFEPFFTTKGPGQGTGLGLASVHGIVAQAGGYVTVASVPELGTTFSLYFRPQRDGDRGPFLSPPEERSTPDRSLTVLVAEDEPAVRAVMQRILARAGYRVLTAASGDEAFDLLTQHLEEIDVLLTDLVMPGMNGHELAVRAIREKPTLPVLFVSGYIGDAVQIPPEVVQAGKFLQKPFTTDELLDRVRRISAA